MSITKHTAEPWFHVYHHGGSFVTDSPLPESGKWNGNTIATEATNIRAVADHARIVACVNGCTGIGEPSRIQDARKMISDAVDFLETYPHQYAVDFSDYLKGLKEALNILGG